MPFMRRYNTLTVTGTTAIRVPLVKRGVVDFAVGADWTPAAGDVKILVDGTAAANVTNLPTAVAGANTGAVWEFVLTAAELSCKQCEVIISDAATKAVEDQSFIVETFGHASAMYQADLSAANLPADVKQWLASTPNALQSGRVDGYLGAVASGVIAAASFAANALDAVWSTATRLLTAGTNIVLAKGTGVTGFNDLSAAQVNAEADTALSDVGLTTTITGRVDAAISTRLASASYTAPLDASGTRTAVGLASANLDTQLGDLSTALSGLNDLSTADVLSQVNAALQAAVADSVPADGVRPSIAQGIYLLTQFMLERSVSGTTLTINKPDGTTALLTLTLNSATAPTALTRAS